MENIIDLLSSGEPIRLDDPKYAGIQDAVTRTLSLIPALNSSTSVEQTRVRLAEIMEREIDESTVVFPPFHTNFGRYIKLGKNVFINHACSFLDMGGITIEDNVLIGPRVNLVTENHPLDPSDRKALLTKPILIKKNAWLGAAVTVLPGVTIGENSIIAAGAVVTADVPPNVIVGGVPAKIIKSL